MNKKMFIWAVLRFREIYDNIKRRESEKYERDI